MRGKTIKLLEENTGGNHHGIGFGNDFLSMTPKAQVTKEKIDKLDDIKIKNFCSSKDMINRVKWQPTKWETIFANHKSDKGLISRIHKELLKLNKDNSKNSKIQK